MTTPVWGSIVGQPSAVAHLDAATAAPVHAYLLVGPPGAGGRDLARSFAAALLCDERGCGTCIECSRVLSDVHPDVVVVEREGASISIGQIRNIVTEASRSPLEGSRKVLVLSDFHLVEQRAPALLKTLEEPPLTTVFVILADAVPPELVTIASRCVRIDLALVPEDILAAALRTEGVAPELATRAAAAAEGSIERARLIAADPDMLDRRAVWSSVPDRLDGTGAAVAALVDEARAAVDGISGAISVRQAAERAAIEERAARYGWKGVTRTDEDRWTREGRRARTDELRAGLRCLLTAYRHHLSAESSTAIAAAASAMDAIQVAAEVLVRNPNEVLLLQGLFSRLSGPSEDLRYSSASAAGGRGRPE